MNPRHKLKLFLSLFTLLPISAAILMILKAPSLSPPKIPAVPSPIIRRQTRRPVSAALIIDRIKTCGELVTVHVEAGPWEEKMRQDTEIAFWPDVQETISALVCGRISYGVDLSDIKPADLNVADEGRKIVIRLPPVRKLGARLDLERTRILGHTRSWYWARDSTLREAVLSQAEARLKDTEAPRAKLRAKKKAEEVVEGLVRQLVGPDVGVEFVEAGGEEVGR